MSSFTRWPEHRSCERARGVDDGGHGVLDHVGPTLVDQKIKLTRLSGERGIDENFLLVAYSVFQGGIK